MASITLKADKAAEVKALLETIDRLKAQWGECNRRVAAIANEAAEGRAVHAVDCQYLADHGLVFVELCDHDHGSHGAEDSIIGPTLQ